MALVLLVTVTCLRTFGETYAKPACRGVILRWTVIMAATLLAACARSPKLPVTGEVHLRYLRASQGEAYFGLTNQSAQAISFMGVRTRSEANPWQVMWECKEVPDAPFWETNPYPLRDGSPDAIRVSSGEQMDLVVPFDYETFEYAKYQKGLCRLKLDLVDTREDVQSDAFPLSLLGDRPKRDARK